MTEETRYPIKADQSRDSTNDDIIDTYTALFGRIWQQALPVLGGFTMRVILQRAIRLTARQAPLLSSLLVDEQGLNSTHLRAQMNNEEQETLRQGFEELLLNFFDLLIELTSEKVVHKLFSEELLKKRP
jgi:hypothetical protein